MTQKLPNLIAAATILALAPTAQASCSHGVGGVDHEEETGSCSFTCLAAP
jgi:hypothetical protein